MEVSCCTTNLDLNPVIDQTMIRMMIMNCWNQLM